MHILFSSLDFLALPEVANHQGWQEKNYLQYAGGPELLL